MKILSGKLLAEKLIQKELIPRIKILNKKSIQPKLTVFLIGQNPASLVYVKQKQKLGERCGIKVEIKNFPETITEKKLLEEIEKENKNKNTHGIIVQLPLPKKLSPEKIIEKIDPKKDVDGLTSVNMGKLFKGEKTLTSCTAKGVMKLLESQKKNLEGTRTVILGRSNLVGKPLAALLINKGATVTICNSKTKNIKDYTQNAEILIVAIGHAEKISHDMINPKSTIIDVGIHKKKDGCLCGDVAEKAKSKCICSTPVPGGVGPMTVYCLMENVIEATENQR